MLFEMPGWFYKCLSELSSATEVKSISFISRYRETCSVSDWELSGRPTELNDMIVENIGQSLAQSPLNL
jgi:hypothetical protein